MILHKLLPISIIIPTLNRHDSLVTTINSILMFDYIPNQIIIIDQSNYEIVQKNALFLKQIHKTTILHKIVEFKSSSKARNLGVKSVINDIIIFSDDDVEVYDDTLKNVYSNMNNNQIALICGLDSSTYLNNQSFLPYILFYKNPFKMFEGHISLSMNGHFPYKISGNLVKTEWAMGFFFVVRKSLISKYNIHFDENLTDYSYGEDLDFSLRYIKSSNLLGLSSFICKNVNVKHNVSKEFRIPQESQIKKYYYARLYLIYKNKNSIFSYFHFYLFNFLYLLKYSFKPKVFKLHLKYILLTISKFNLIKDGNL